MKSVPLYKTNLYEIQQYDARPCELKTFTIHGEPAEISDFGTSEDVGGPTEYEDINRYGCSDHQFKADESNRESAKKTYNITDSEFDEICDILEDVLNVGMCGWCI